MRRDERQGMGEGEETVWRLTGVPFLRSLMSLSPEEKNMTGPRCVRGRGRGEMGGEVRVAVRKDMESNHSLPEPRPDLSARLKTGSTPVSCLTLRELMRSFLTKMRVCLCAF